MFEAPMDKLHEVARMAMDERQRLAREEGIGVDLPMNLFGWRGADIAVAAQVGPRLSTFRVQDRFRAVAGAAFALRRGFQVDSYTLVTDGFVGEAGFEGDLRAAFAAGDPRANECLWVAHVEAGDPRFLCANLTYRYNYRSVEFAPQRLEVSAIDTGYPVVLARALVVEAPQRLPRAVQAGIVRGVEGMGMLVETYP